MQFYLITHFKHVKTISNNYYSPIYILPQAMFKHKKKKLSNFLNGLNLPQALIEPIHVKKFTYIWTMLRI